LVAHLFVKQEEAAMAREEAKFLCNDISSTWFPQESADALFNEVENFAFIVTSPYEKTRSRSSVDDVIFGLQYVRPPCWVDDMPIPIVG
jgi:hypothetical protein